MRLIVLLGLGFLAAVNAEDEKKKNHECYRSVSHWGRNILNW